MGKPVNGLEKIYINFKHNIVKKEELWTLPVEDVDLHPDSHLKRNALFWHEGEVGGVLLLVGVQVGVGVELVEQGGVSEVEMGEGDIGGGVELASAYVEQTIGKVHGLLVARERVELRWGISTVLCTRAVNLRKDIEGQKSVRKKIF